MPNTQSKIAPIEMEDSHTTTTAVELLATKITLEEQQRQQNDCINLITQYSIPPTITEWGSLRTYTNLYQFTSAKRLQDEDFLNFDRLINTQYNQPTVNRIETLYDDIVRCVTLETKQILTYIEKQRKKCEAKKISMARSKSFDITTINEKLGPDIMRNIQSYMPIQTMVEAYANHLHTDSLYDKLTQEVATFNRINMREIFEIAVDIMGKRREQLLTALYKRYEGRATIRANKIRALRLSFDQIFQPVFKSGSSTTRSYSTGQKRRLNSIIQVARNCLKYHDSDTVVKMNIQQMGMDFADLIKHLYNYSDYKKSLYYQSHPNGENNTKKMAKAVKEKDYKKIKYLYEEVGESWKIIAYQCGRGSHTAIKRLYEKEKEKEFIEEHKKACQENRRPHITGFYENMKKNKYFHYIKYGLQNEKNIRKFLSRPLIE